eukprot:gb/GECH01003457.1/.p1 GENE.gb/GECH01003457.1/~~gb/GECH01003457.1/.p1  ORF type:complete len:171 (+),score=27.08 gb/GECH01003457.1/:1-513(+)
MKQPLNINKWIEENRDKLQPPVGNYMLFDEGEFKVMVIGGPNIRSDYHVEEGEEFFYQLKGDMVLKVVENSNEFRDIPIKEGEMFVLPGRIPHSPQRFSDTIGLVLERERTANEEDALRWYCEACREIVYQEVFHCEDLGEQLKPVIQRYYASEERRTCKACRHVNSVPK